MGDEPIDGFGDVLATVMAVVEDDLGAVGGLGEDAIDGDVDAGMDPVLGDHAPHHSAVAPGFELF